MKEPLFWGAQRWLGRFPRYFGRRSVRVIVSQSCGSTRRICRISCGCPASDLKSCGCPSRGCPAKKCYALYGFLFFFYRLEMIFLSKCTVKTAQIGACGGLNSNDFKIDINNQNPAGQIKILRVPRYPSSDPAGPNPAGAPTHLGNYDPERPA